MNYRDQWVTNEQGKKFLFTVEMQRKLDHLGLPVEPASLSQLEEVSDSRPADQESSRDQPSRPDYRDRDSRDRDQRSRDYRDRNRRDEGRETAVSVEAETADAFAEPLTIQIDPQTGKYIGRMKWYNTKKGYGFIVRGAGEEIFFHKTGTVGEPTDLQEGQWILYDVEETHKGPEATEVEPYNGDPDLLE